MYEFAVIGGTTLLLTGCIVILWAMSRFLNTFFCCFDDADENADDLTDVE